MFYKSQVALFIGLQFLFCQTILADGEKSVLLRAASVAPNDYVMAIEADHRLETFGDFWSHRDEDLRRELRLSYAHAQEVFLQGEMHEVRSEWEKVASFAPKSDWSKTYRRIIQTAQLRRAQVALNPAETDQWLKSALNIDAAFEPDKTLFPPPLIENYHRLRTHLKRTLVSLGPASGFDTLLVNGVAYNLDAAKKVFLPTAIVRATFLSSRYMPVSRVVNTHDLAKLRPEALPFLGGTCANPEIKSDGGIGAGGQSVALMYDKQCVISDSNPTRNRVGVATSAASPTLTYLPAEGIEKNYGTQTTSAPFYKKTWFWVGATVVAGGLFALAQSHSSSPSSQPTHTEGF